MVKTSVHAETNGNVQYIRWRFSEGWSYDFEKAVTPTTAPQRHNATDHGDGGAPGSSGSCSANGPGGCRVFANYCCSVRVCARGQICGLTSRQHLEKKYLVPISAWDRDGTPLFGGFSDLGNCQNQHSSPHAAYIGLTVGESLNRSRSMAYIGVA